jgi:hypothetical protein
VSRPSAAPKRAKAAVGEPPERRLRRQLLFDNANRKSENSAESRSIGLR